MLIYNCKRGKEKERKGKKMIWVTYEEFTGRDWDRRLTSCTSSEYEALKRRHDVVIISVERVRII